MCVITLVMPLHQPGSANAAASVCLYMEQERSLRCRLIVRPCPTAGLGSPIPSIWGPVGNRVPHRAPRLWFDKCATVPETQLLSADVRAHPPTTLTDCPATSTRGGGARRFPSRRPETDRPLRFPGRTSPVAPSPGRFATFWGAPPPVMSINRSMGSRHRPVTVSGPASDHPPPLRASTGNPTPFTPVKGTHSGEIESRSRPGNCNSGIQYNKNSAKQQIITNLFRLIKLFCFNSSACKQIRKINQPNFSCYNKSTTISTVQYMTA